MGGSRAPPFLLKSDPNLWWDKGDTHRQEIVLLSLSISYQESRSLECDCTANEGPVRIQYKCLVPIYVFPEMKLLFQKQNYNVLSSSSYTHISVRDLYISSIGLPILLQENMQTDPGNI